MLTQVPTSFLVLALAACLVTGDIHPIHRSPLKHGGAAFPIHSNPVHLGGLDHHLQPVHHAGPVHLANPVHVVDDPISPIGPVHLAKPGYHAKPLPYVDDYKSGPAHYNYDYLVHDEYAGTHFGHSEARQDYRTEGKYFVHLPDGRIQTVTYYADETGYHPTVTYDGEAAYPQVVAPVVGYDAPKVVYRR